MDGAHSVVLTTAASRSDAREIARRVLSDRLAACVQLLPIESLYTWKGEVAEEAEILLLIKTRAELYGALEHVILSVHSYETPEILMLPVAQGLTGYLSWIDEVTSLRVPAQDE
ncbi:MAG: divalent-cation tolerance protein CutA [Acidimicrobiales bacterium]|jgi:periplasmic divalent cation tolerance protein